MNDGGDCRTAPATTGLLKMESPQGLSEKFAHGNSLGSSDFPSGVRPSGKSNDSWEFPREKFSDNPCGLFTVCTREMN